MTPKLRKLTTRHGGKPRLNIHNVVAAFDEGEFLRLPPGRLALTRTFELARLSSIASGECARRAYGWGSRRLATDALLDALAQVPDVLTGILPTDGRLPVQYKPELAAAIARGTAIGIHVRLHNAFHSGRSGSVRAGGAAAALRRLEDRYHQHLQACWRATRTGDGQALRALAATMTSEAHGALADATRRAGSASRGARRTAPDMGLRASVLGRRYAFLAAGCVLVDARVRTPRRAPSARRAAQAADRLSRTVMRVPLARRTVRELDAGSRIELAGRASGVTWIERPRKPYTRIGLDGVGVPLLVSHKNMVRRGLGVGCHVWALGNVKKVRPEELAVECEFEGPEIHRKTYFEDWLVTVARPAYDLYPGSVAMEWEFPPIDRRRAGWDLYSRLGARSAP